MSNGNGNGSTPTLSPVPTRDELRAKLFAHRDIRKKTITFRGVELELWQPKVGDIIEAANRPDREAAMIEQLIKYAYIPGTDIHVFEEGDVESMKEMGFDDDFVKVNEALEELTAVNFRGQSKSLSKTVSSTESSISPSI